MNTPNNNHHSSHKSKLCTSITNKIRRTKKQALSNRSDSNLSSKHAMARNFQKELVNLEFY